jgi:serine/threonine protein kinase
MDAEELGRKSPYRAPEISEGRSDFKSDLFAFGVLLYEMLVGHKPIKSWQTLTPTGGRLSTEALSKLSAFPENVRALIADCVTIDRAVRPEASEALARLVGRSVRDERQVETPNAILERGARALTLEVQEFLGRGASAQVYRALNHDETTVLKIFNIETPQELVRHERNMNRRVASPAVVKVHSAFQWPDGRSGLEFQDVGGASMRAAIEAGERPDRDRFAQVADRLLSGISDLHEDHVANPEDRKPLLHNDLNPANILLTDSGVYIIDLGAASEPSIGPFCGIPLYVAPDLALGGEMSREPNGDLFTAAISLFEWVTGRHPFGGRIPGTSKLDLSPLPDWAADLTPWFEKALDSEAGRRFASAAAMRQELGPILSPPDDPRGEVTTPEPTGEQKSIDEPAEMPVHRETPQGCGARAFVAYLNTLHNVSASNENALAESQALSPYFGQLHVPVTGVTDDLEKLLRAPSDAVVVLSGHAGDGKSTIALDLYRRIKGLPHDKPLERPLLETEVLELEGRKIAIIKDLSELAAEKRLAAFREAFTEAGTWLIIANTGPLLNTCIALGKDGEVPRHEVEDELLRVLSAPLRAGVGDAHKVGLFKKPLWVANLTKSDNVPLAGKVLKNLVSPHLWSDCSGCPAKSQCPIALNVESIRECPEAITRVERVYRRLTEYDQRLTARQLTAHLAYSITGGLECADVVISRPDPAEFVGNHMFADRFFGSASATFEPKADELQVVRLLHPLELGAAPFREVDCLTTPSVGLDKLGFGPTFHATFKAQVARLPQGRDRSRLRQSYRRQVYFFASSTFRRFRDDFLKSPRLFDMEDWFKAPPSRQELRTLRNKTLGVILEEFTGFSAGQYSRNNQILYITLRRGDLRFPQMVQLVLARTSFDDFTFHIEPNHREITLRYKPRSGDNITLDLSLPLLDYIAYRQLGEVGEALDPIFRQRIDTFKAALLASSREHREASADDGVLEVIQATVSGALRICEVEFRDDGLHIDYA